eukprot:6491970-Amphidinium_carterae.2
MFQACLLHVPFQDDVKKLRASMGQARSTILTTIAVAMQGSPWWMRLVDEFLEKCPAQIEAEPKIKSFVQTLEKINAGPVSIQAVKELIPISETLPSLLHALRPGCLSSVLESFKSALLYVWTICDTELVLTSQDTQDLTRLLNNALILWPTDAELQGFSEAATQMMEKSSEEALAKEILHVMDQVEKGSLDDDKPFMQNVLTLTEKLAGSNVDMQLYMTEGQNTGQHTVTHLLDFMLKYWIDEPHKSDKYHPVLVCVDHVGNSFQDFEVQKLASALKCGLACLQAEVLVHKVPQTPSEGHTIPVSALLNLRRQLQECEKAFAEPVPACFDHDVVKKLSAKLKVAKLSYEKLKTATLAKRDGAFKAALEKLASVASGMPNHQDWCQGYSGNDWASFAQHAQETLLKQSGVDLKKTEESLQQVLVLAH